MVEFLDWELQTLCTAQRSVRVQLQNYSVLSSSCKSILIGVVRLNWYCFRGNETVPNSQVPINGIDWKHVSQMNDLSNLGMLLIVKPCQEHEPDVKYCQCSFVKGKCVTLQKFLYSFVQLKEGNQIVTCLVNVTTYNGEQNAIKHWATCQR